MAPFLYKCVWELRHSVQGDTVEQLLPLFLTLLKDEWPDVRLAIIGKLQAVNQVCCRWRWACMDARG